MDDHNSQGKAQRCSLQDLGCTNWTGFERWISYVSHYFYLSHGGVFYIQSMLDM
jgi:hypothetical protein